MFFIVMGIIEIVVCAISSFFVFPESVLLGVITLLSGIVSASVFIAVGVHSKSIDDLENKVVILEDKQKFSGRKILILEAMSIQKDEKNQLDEVTELLRKSVVDTKGYYNALYNGYLNAINHAEYLKNMLASLDEKYTETNKNMSKIKSKS